MKVEGDVLIYFHMKTRSVKFPIRHAKCTVGAASDRDAVTSAFFDFTQIYESSTTP
jgi:hypothetical protein